MARLPVIIFMTILGAGATAGVSPVTKVLHLMSDMQAKIIAEGEAAHATYAKFAEMCEDRSKDLSFQIKTAKSEISDLKAAIAEEESIAVSLGTKVEELTSSIATDEADLEAATKIRSTDQADFAADEKELTEVIDTLQRAIGIMEKHASLLQSQSSASVVGALDLMVQAAALTSADAKQISALIQSSRASEDEIGAPAAAVYEGHSGGIVDTLSDLLEKAETQLADARSKETASLQQFAMLKQSLVDKIKYETKELAEAKKGIAAAGEKKAAAQGDLEITSSNLKEDGTALSELHHQCLTKAQDHESETKSRGEELKALATAKAAIEESTSGAAGLAYGLNQVSFMQYSGSSAMRAVHFMRDLAQKQHTPALAQLAARMAAVVRSSDDPFAKVRSLISDMIETLEAEAGKDAAEKAYCDKELAETNAKKDDKSTEIKKLTTKIDQMTSRSAQLKAAVAELENALAALAKAQAEMDAVRMEEKDEYASCKQDMEEGIKGVRLALKVLRDYYAKDKSHVADEGGGAGIIGLLEVVESDFSKGLVETTTTEESAKAAYEEETKENEIEKATKEQDVKYKKEEAAGLDKAIAEATSDRAGVQEELDAVLEYLRGIEGKCIAKPESYEEREKRRQAEIAGLKEALAILESDSSFMQQNSQRSLRGVRLHMAA